MNSLDSVKKLNLPKGKFAIFWSSILSIRNIREADDIDILVKEDVRDSLARTYPVKDKWYQAIEIGKIEIMKDRIHLYGKENEMIDTAEIIEWLPFVKIEYFKTWKEKIGREKDKRDLALLSEYEKKKKKQK